MIKFTCPNCQKKLGVDDSQGGKTVRCPQCGTTTITPKPEVSPIREKASDYPPLLNPYGISDSTKLCPFCGETILEKAKKCKHCGEFIDGSRRLPSLNGTRGISPSNLHTGRKALYTFYDQVPWYRKNGFALLCVLIFPLALVPFLITGDIYYEKRGQVAIYGTARKICLIILILFLQSLCFLFWHVENVHR